MLSHLDCVLQVQIAACDTFRSGAVEQLRTHCNRLSIPLYERGYEKDPAKVAYEAIKSAERSNIDVLLVDTAGETSHQEACCHKAVRCCDQLEFCSLLADKAVSTDHLPCDSSVNGCLQGACKIMSP